MNSVLIVMDMQNDFVTGSLGSAAARAIVPNVVERVTQAKRDGEIVMFTQDTHGADYMNTNEGRHLPVAHCQPGTEGHKLVPELQPLAKDSRVAEKSTFGSLWLMGELAGMARAYGSPEGDGMRVELCGLCTDICVITNALMIKARLPEADIVVQANLCAGLSPEKHLAALEVLKSCQVQVIE